MAEEQTSGWANNVMGWHPSRNCQLLCLSKSLKESHVRRLTSFQNNSWRLEYSGGKLTCVQEEGKMTAEKITAPSATECQLVGILEMNREGFILEEQPPRQRCGPQTLTARVQTFFLKLCQTSQRAASKAKSFIIVHLMTLFYFLAIWFFLNSGRNSYATCKTSMCHVLKNTLNTGSWTHF